MDSIKYAEKKVGASMPTPIRLEGDGHSPVKYDTAMEALDSKVDNATL